MANDLVRPVERVIVVGAGISGLTVANALTSAGVECLVVEARDRIGGRLHTIDLDGTPVDLGGSWIHQPEGNPLYAYAQQARVATRDGDAVPAMGAYDAVEGRQLSTDEVEGVLESMFDGFLSAIEDLRGSLPADASAADAAVRYVEGLGLVGHERRRALQSVRATVEGDAAASWETQSLRWFGNEIEYGGNYFGALPDDGYRSIVGALGAGLDVRLSSEVAHVESSPSGVRVSFTDGTVESGSHVVVTVPLGVLKRGAIAFEPELPRVRLDAIDRLGFGRYEKVALAFAEPFWAATGLSHHLLFTPRTDEAALFVVDLHAFGLGPVLLLQVFHSLCRHVVAVSPDDAVGWALELLGQAFGETCPEPTAVSVTSWGDDPFAGGSYTHIPPGADPSMLDLLGEPLGGRVLFAGEHTSSERMGFADGAMSSGVREAGRLLRTLGIPDVHLTPPPRR